MDVSRYNFSCQKALHLGWRLARKLNHPHLEVEHVAMAMLQHTLIDLNINDSSDESLDQKKIEKTLHHFLVARSRVLGVKKVEFGPRLDRALDAAESKASIVNEELLWKALVAESTLLKQTILKNGGKDSLSERAQKEDKGSGKVHSEDKLGSSQDDLNAKDEELLLSFEEDFSEPGATEKSKERGKKYKNLKKFGIDLTEKASRGELDPVIGRDFEVRRVLEVIGRKRKNNPLLIGQAGVGKTAIVEALAQRIAGGKVPEVLKDKKIFALDINSLLAGARYRGDFEQRLKDVLAEIKEQAGQIIVFIDEIHTIVGAGKGEGANDAANILKPSLARGELHCIGATTTDEYRKYIEKDPALERRFQPVDVREPSADITVGILRGLKPHYEVHHGVQIEDEAIVSSVKMSMRYLPERNLPDKAIDLIDEAASRLRLQTETKPAVLERIGAKISRLEIELAGLLKGESASDAVIKLRIMLGDSKRDYEAIEKVWQKHRSYLNDLRVTEVRIQELTEELEKSKSLGSYDEAAKIQYEQIPPLKESLGSLKEKLQNLQNKHAWLSQTVGAYEIGAVLSEWTGIPLGKLLKQDSDRVLGLEDRLAQKIIGQSDAISAIGRVVKRAKAGIQNPNRPLGVFLLVGPTGVGKTHTAKELSVELYDDPSSFIRIDMSEYMEQHSVARLIGSPPGYLGHGESGELCEKVRRRPYSLVLLDEIEKAHPRVLDILLQVFDDGRLTDGQGRTVDFRNTIIIMTSNLLGDLMTFGRVSSDDLRKELTGELRPELVNRIDEVVGFRPLGRHSFEKIFDVLLVDLNGRLAERKIRLVVAEKLRAKILDGLDLEVFGARLLERRFRYFVEDHLAVKLVEAGADFVGVWRLSVDEDEGAHWEMEFEPHKYLPAAAV